MVFSTVKNIIEDFVSNNPVRGFIFSAKEPSRIKLYNRFAKIFQKSGFPKIAKIDDDGYLFFAIAVDDKTLKLMSDGIANS